MKTKLRIYQVFERLGKTIVPCKDGAIIEPVFFGGKLKCITLIVDVQY